MSEFKIVKAGKHDLSVVHKLIMELLAEVEPMNEMEPLTADYHEYMNEHLRSALSDDRYTFLFIRNDDEPVGVSESRVRQSPDPAQPMKYGYITWFYVRPDHRRKGAGRRLFEATQTVLAARGAEQIRLGALAKNERAIIFWKAMGFDPGVITLFRKV